MRAKTMNKLFIYLIIVININDIGGIKRTWKYNVDADDPQNWIDPSKTTSCRGFYFPREFDQICQMSLKSLTTSEILLPHNGDVVLPDDAEIVLSEQSKECIRVKQRAYKRWDDPESWISEVQSNSAVPHTTRIPCQCDDVIFGNNSLFAVVLPPARMFVRSVYFHGPNWWLLVKDYDECSEIINDVPEVPVNIWIRKKDCSAKTVCHENLEEVLGAVCAHFRDTEAVCNDPVHLTGHCFGFCGAAFYVEASEKFSLNDFEQKLKNNDVDVYSTPIETNGRILWQISLTDRKEYTGSSVLLAQKVFETMHENKEKEGILSILLKTSGRPSQNDKTFKTAMGSIFGTLIFVISIFGILYLFYEGPLQKYSFSKRINLARYNQALRRSVIFSRFDDQEHCGISIAGSVMSLEKAFDNPMYGHPVPSTSKSSSVETVIDTADEVVEQDSEEQPSMDVEFKNPLYGENDTTSKVSKLGAEKED